MTVSKPAKQFLFEAVPTGDGRYWARWAAPGMIPDYVIDYSDGDTAADHDLREVFDTEDDAEHRALWVMFSAMNARYKRDSMGRVVSGKNVRHTVPTGAEAAAMMRDANINPSELAHLWGAKTTDVGLEWVDGVRPVPFAMWFVIPLLADPKVREFVFKTVAEYTTPRNPQEAR